VTRRWRPVDADEEGAALVMAVIVMIVLATLSTAVLARTLSVLNFVRQGQDYDAALAAADAGVADALFKIDQTAPASWTASGATGGGTFEYWSKKISDTQYVVSSIGTVGASKHGVQVRVTRTAQFPYALFSSLPLTLDGAASAGPVKVAFYAFTGTERVRVGSNATVVCNGPLPDNVIVDWYSSRSECPTTRINRLANLRDLTIQEPPKPAGVTDPNWERCPTTTEGVFGSPTIQIGTDPVTGAPIVVPSTITNPTVISGNAGPYVCRRNTTMLGTIVPKVGEKPVQIYVLPRYDTLGKVTETYSLDMSAAIINPQQSATQFQIYKVGDKAITHNSADTVTFRGVLFAPDTVMRINGGHLSWAGSINVGQLTVNGAPNLKIGYDFDLTTYFGPDWRVSRYREISSTEARPATFP